MFALIKYRFVRWKRVFRGLRHSHLGQAQSRVPEYQIDIKRTKLIWLRVKTIFWHGGMEGMSFCETDDKRNRFGVFQKFAEFPALCCQQDALADGFYVFLLPLGRADSRRPQRYRNHRRQTVELAHDIELFRIDLRQKFLRRDFAMERTCCQFPHLVCCFPHWGFLSKKSSNISVAALCCFIPFLSFVVQPTKVILHRKKSLFERRDKWAIPKQSLKSRRLRAKWVRMKRLHTARFEGFRSQPLPVRHKPSRQS